ncbi:hypothetical protein [Corynebacterium sp. UBA2622]|uniref:hypothetical protein n=1 Tax=Corynebacterium sp. UBA2622 TaxID=1946393 RepID=UPI0025BBB2F8|nr:hypothetical protein [Corynebacterium sp. UBA2622]
MKRFLPLLLASAVVFTGAPAHAMDVRGGWSDPRSAVAVYHPGGTWTGTPNAAEPRPALSLAKLYLGYWVLRYGAPEDQWRVEDMIRRSDDGTATDLDRRYPQAIDETARDYGLGATHRVGSWGNTTTSALDAAKFVSDIEPDPAAGPLLTGMRTAAPVAADGFVQNYGTSQLPGAQGTKYGWSDDFATETASVSFGDGWSAAALTYGGAQANTDDAVAAVEPGITDANGGWTSSAGPVWAPAVPLRNVLAPYLPMNMLTLIPADVLVPVGAPHVDIPGFQLPF